MFNKFLLYLKWIAGGNCPVTRGNPISSSTSFDRDNINGLTMKEIILSQGKVALVDDEDYEWLNQFKWCAIKQHRTFYAAKSVKRNGKWTSERMHRLFFDIPMGKEIDHIDHNGLNNQKINLRECSHSENNSNRTGYGISKYLGVSKNTFKRKNKNNTVIFSCWVAQIKGKKLGNFKTEIEAAEKYNEYAKIIHGEFANLNII